MQFSIFWGSSPSLRVLGWWSGVEAPTWKTITGIRWSECKVQDDGYPQEVIAFQPGLSICDDAEYVEHLYLWILLGVEHLCLWILLDVDCRGPLPLHFNRCRAPLNLNFIRHRAPLPLDCIGIWFNQAFESIRGLWFCEGYDSMKPLNLCYRIACV